MNFPEDPVYTGMLSEHNDPFVLSSRLRHDIAEASVWEPRQRREAAR